MSEWKTISADVFCDSVRDGTHDTPKQVEKGYKLVTAKHINNGQVDLSDAYLISEQDYLKINERSKVEQWDVLMSMIGNGLGKSAVVKDNPEYAIKNLALFKLGDEIKAKWLHYYLSSKAGQGFIYNSLQGSGQPFISLSLLRKFPIPVPNDETIMGDVVTVLSRYDSLIENYQKQIKLLEEAAQRLYKEWFIDLRFPGHENTKIVDGVPEGWEKKKLIDIAKLKAGGDKPEVFSKEKTSELKVPIFSNGTINDGLYGYTDIAEINDPCVTISARGSVGYTVLRRKPFVPIVRLISVIPSNVYVGYLYFFIKGMPIESNGAAQQQITVPMIKNKVVIIPPDIILNFFKEKEEFYFSVIENYKEQILYLSEARDRLLPKLMSGDFDERIVVN